MFEDREDAGKKLAAALKKIKNAVVFGIPRGGVVTAFYVSKELRAPLDVIVARKLGAPHEPELAIGAVAPDGSIYLDEDLVKQMEVSEGYIDSQVRIQLEEIKRRTKIFRNSIDPPQVKGKVAIVVDDGIATGYTMLAAIYYLRKLKPKKIIVAVPVSSPESLRMIEEKADSVICLEEHEPFYAIGMYYENFEQVSDEKVVSLLRKSVLT
jgi:predicted phosphoribosyltransferase